MSPYQEGREGTTATGIMNQPAWDTVLNVIWNKTRGSELGRVFQVLSHWVMFYGEWLRSQVSAPNSGCGSWTQTLGHDAQTLVSAWPCASRSVETSNRWIKSLHYTGVSWAHANPPSNPTWNILASCSAESLQMMISPDPEVSTNNSALKRHAELTRSLF